MIEHLHESKMSAIILYKSPQLYILLFWSPTHNGEVVR